MGGDLCLIYGGTEMDNVRPNASLALFRRDDTGVELVFYTRFFVVSYAMGSKKTTKARDLCRTHNYNALTGADRDTVFKSMHDMYTVQAFDSVVSSKKPTRYQLQIKSVSHLTYGKPATFHIPYIYLRDKNMNTPPWFRVDKKKCSSCGHKPCNSCRKEAAKQKKLDYCCKCKQAGLMIVYRTKHNTIHGMIPTKGCWMLLRNYVWNWPDEERHYLELSRELIRERISDVLDRAKVRPLLATPDIHHTEVSDPDRRTYDRFYWWGTNPAYLELLHLLGGLKYDLNHARIFSYPKGTAGSDPNCFKRQASAKWEPNVFGHQAHNGSWTDLYLFKRNDRFTKDSGDTDEFK